MLKSRRVEDSSAPISSYCNKFYGLMLGVWQEIEEQRWGLGGGGDMRLGWSAGVLGGGLEGSAVGVVEIMGWGDAKARASKILAGFTFYRSNTRPRLTYEVTMNKASRVAIFMTNLAMQPLGTRLLEIS
ncbi:hypothetical protein Tco_0623277 [Tanacetum coccineum]